MHHLAEEWDKKYGRSVKHQEIRNGKFIPKNRPCDWCGGKVDLGFIHKDCGAKEADFYHDIF